MFESKSFSKNQRRGLYVLFVICLSSWIIRFYFVNNPNPAPVEVVYLAKQVNDTVLFQREPVKKSQPSNYPKKVKKAKRSFENSKNKKVIANQRPIISFSEASAENLMEISGVGPVLSKRILKFRDKLGGFYSPNQIYEVYGLDSVVAKRVINRFSFKGNVNLIDVNVLSVDSLAKHPYLSYREAKAIVRFVKEVRPFDSVSEIGYLNEISSDNFRKIAPYLSVKNAK